ncbi:cache domain-containing protein [Malaciobacter marinus]|uniref:Cache sensor-containing signal transduction protein n=2 Tax=Malaciobacter marinus TaxID=505249 RepID=A0A347TNL9_9BACT|nr:MULTISPECIES: cache domain-containing protein [Malaciobacter]AXX88197.1 Cache sensor-containing signal transduction protein [Malaciobacter marinus]
MTINKNFVFLILFVAISSFFLFWAFNNYMIYEQKSSNEDTMDVYLNDLAKEIKKNKELVLTSAVLISKNDDIKRCLKTNNKQDCIKYLQKSKRSLVSTSLFKDIKIHLHRKDLKSFFRLWDLKNSKNDSLKDFRYCLKIVKNEKKAKSCIEIGRFSMLIRGVSPVVDNGEYLGSIEAIIDFSSIIEHFKEKDIKLYVLMNKDYLSIPTKVKFKKEQILNNYVILNNKIENFSFLDNKRFEHTGYIKKSNYYLLYTPIYNISKEQIGTYVLKIYI